MAEPFSLLQELGLEPSAVRQPFGVLHGCVVTEPHVSAAGEHSRLISELVTAAQLLRARMAPPHFPMALVADTTYTLRTLYAANYARLWDRHVRVKNPQNATERWRQRAMERRVRPEVSASWIWKLATFSLTPFNATLYLDADVLVLSRFYARDLLTNSLRVSDIAAPTDPARQAGRPPAYHRLHELDHGIPMPCAGVMAYRLGANGVQSFLDRVAWRLSSGRDETKLAARYRVGDQEVMWEELWRVESADALPRLLLLPDEYLCPFYRQTARTLLTGADPDADARKKLVGADATATWKTSWGSYSCHALHGHVEKYFSSTKEEGYEILNLTAYRPRWPPAT